MPSTVLDLNFDDAPPATGGGGFGDHVPPGPYHLLISKVGVIDTSTGKKMVTIEALNSDKKRITDNFTIPRAGTDDSKFPLQRLHALMIACGANDMTGKGTKPLDMAVLKGREFIGDVIDDIIPARDKYPEKTVSRLNSYYRVGSKEAEEAMAAANGPVLTTSAPEPAAQPENMSFADAPPAATEAEAPATAPQATPLEAVPPAASEPVPEPTVPTSV